MDESLGIFVGSEAPKAPTSVSEIGRWIFKGRKRSSQQQGVPEGTWGEDGESNVLSEPSENSSICELQGIFPIYTGSSSPYEASADAEPFSPCHEFATPQGSVDARGGDSAASTPQFSSARRSLWKEHSSSEALSEDYSRHGRTIPALRARRALLPEASTGAPNHFLEDPLGLDLAPSRAGSEVGGLLPRQAGAAAGITAGNSRKSGASRLLFVPRAITALVTPLKNSMRSRAASDAKAQDQNEIAERTSVSQGYCAAATPSRVPRRATYDHAASPVAHGPGHRPSTGPGWAHHAERKGLLPFQSQVLALHGNPWPRDIASGAHSESHSDAELRAYLYSSLEQHGAPAILSLGSAAPAHLSAFEPSFDGATPSSVGPSPADIVSKMYKAGLAEVHPTADGAHASEASGTTEPGKLDQEVPAGGDHLGDLVGTGEHTTGQATLFGQSASARGAPAVPPISAAVLKGVTAQSSEPQQQDRPHTSAGTGGLPEPPRGSGPRPQPNSSTAAPSRISRKTAAIAKKGRGRHGVSHQPQVEYSLQDPVKVLERVRELEAQLERERAAREARQRQFARARLTYQEERGTLSYRQGIMREVGPPLASIPRAARNGVDAREPAMIKSRMYHRQTPVADKSARDGDSRRNSWDSPDMSPGRSTGFQIENASADGGVFGVLEEELSRRDNQWLTEIDKMVCKSRQEKEDLVRQNAALQLRILEMEAAGKQASAEGSSQQQSELKAAGAGALSELATAAVHDADSEGSPAVKHSMEASGIDAEPDTGPPVSTADVELAELRSKQGELEEVVSQLRTQLEAKDAQVADATTAHARSIEELQVAQEALSAAKAEVAELTSANEVLRAKYEAAEEEQRKAMAKIGEMSTGGLVPQSLVIELQSEVDNQRTEIAALKDAQKLLSAKLKESQDALVVAQQTVSASMAREGALQARIDGLEASEKALQESIEMLKVSEKEAQDEGESWRKQFLSANEVLRAKENEVRKGRAEMEAEVQKIKGDKDVLQNEVAALQGKLRWAQQREEELQKEVQVKEGRCNDLQQALHEKTREVSVKEAQVVAVAIEGQEDKSTASVLKVQVEGLQKALAQKEATALKLLGEMEELRASLREARDETSVANIQYRHLEEIARKAEKSNATLRFEAVRLEDEVNRLKSENKNIASKAAETEQEYHELQCKLKAAEVGLQGLVEEKAMLEQNLLRLKVKYGDDDNDELAGYGSMGHFG